MTIDIITNVFDWYDQFSADGVTNVGYGDDIRLMNIMFALMTID